MDENISNAKIPILSPASGKSTLKLSIICPRTAWRFCFRCDVETANRTKSKLWRFNKKMRHSWRRKRRPLKTDEKSTQKSTLIICVWQFSFQINKIIIINAWNVIFYEWKLLKWSNKFLDIFLNLLTLYSVTDLPISIEMISSWIQIVPEFVWMWGGGSPSRNDSWLVFTFLKWMFVSDWPITNCFETETHHPTSTQIRGQSESTRKSFL